MTKRRGLPYKIVGQELPNEVLYVFRTHHLTKEERNLYATALHAQGWTQTVLAEEFGVSRERVRQLIEKIDKAEAIRFVIERDLPTPTPPAHDKPAPHVYIEPSEETLARLLELKPYAELVRSSSPRYRKEAEEYSWLINYAHTVEGVTLYRLAKRLGVTHGALRFRLARYGYKPSPGSTSKVYTPIHAANRAELTHE
jgi:DNA-binding transcriptional regulator LsrR (DeoR family)